jgi:hypothetical protein
MFKCLQCGALFYEPVECHEIIPEDITQVDHWKGCPRCKSDEWGRVGRCQICDADVTGAERYECKDGSIYCTKCCSFHDD